MALAVVADKNEFAKEEVYYASEASIFSQNFQCMILEVQYLDPSVFLEKLAHRH